MTVAKETLAELSVPAGSTPITVLAAAASAAVTTPTIGAVLDPVPPRETGTVPAVISCSPGLSVTSLIVK